MSFCVPFTKQNIYKLYHVCYKTVWMLRYMNDDDTHYYTETSSDFVDACLVEKCVNNGFYTVY